MDTRTLTPSFGTDKDLRSSRVVSKMRVFVLLVFVLAAQLPTWRACAQPAAAPPTAPAAPAAIVLVDGSGSMWGGLGEDGTGKLVAVRHALEQSLPAVATSHRLGLVTFGPGCRAVDVGVAPVMTEPASLVGALSRFNPRGKGPLSAGLRAAADAIGVDSKGHIVVFHDGLDNCGEDACATAASLKASHPGVQVSTVSLGMEPEQIAATACIAKATGGLALTATDLASVSNALAEVTRAMLQQGPTPAAPANAEQTRLVAAEKGPPRLLAAAILSEGAQPLTMLLTWRITDAATGNVLHEAVGEQLKLPLRPGPVRIETSSGRVSVVRDAVIAPEGDTVVDVVLGAGIVRLDTGTKLLASDAQEPTIRLNSLTAPQSAIPLWIARGKAIEALLPPAEYQVVAEYGLARAAAPVNLAAGQVINLSLPLEAGRLELSATPSKLADIVYQVTIDDPDQPGGRRELARTAHTAPAYVLSTGTYTITATAGGESIRRVVTVRSGEVTREAFTFNLAEVNVTATINGAQPERQPLSLSVKRAAPDAASAPWTLEAMLPLPQPLHLPPGSYRVSVVHSVDGPQTTTEVMLAAGEQHQLKLDLKSAELRLDMSAANVTSGSTLCELWNAPDSVVWRTVEPNAEVVVAPGSYTLRCRAGSVTREIPVTLAAAERKVIAPFAP